MAARTAAIQSGRLGSGLAGQQAVGKSSEGLADLRRARGVERVLAAGDGLLVGATIGICNLAAPLGSQPRPQFDQRHARPGDPLSSRPSRRCFGGNAPRSQLTGKAFTETIELDRTRIEAGAIQPFGLHRQMNMRSRRVGVEGQDIIVIVAQLGVGERAGQAVRLDVQLDVLLTGGRRLLRGGSLVPRLNVLHG